MNEALFSCAQSHESCYFVSAAGLTSNPDLLHLNAESQRKFGLRFYEAYRGQKNVTGPVNGENELEETAKWYQSISPGEKIGLLQKDLDAGIITKQEYEMRAADLIREM